MKAKKSKNKVIKKTKKASKSSKNNKAGIERIPTFIPGFDKLIDGGFEKLTTNLVVGGAGSGKSIFAIQTLLGAMDRGEKCLYITFEEKKNRVYDHMMEFGWDLAAYEKKGLFTFLEYSPMKVKTMLDEGGGEIESIILGKKITRVVIDSISSFALLFNDEQNKRESALKLFNMISSWNCTSFLTYEEESIGDNETKTIPSKALQFESDSIIIMHNSINHNARQRYLEILKMRGARHSQMIHRFNITSKGIVIDNKTALKVYKS